MIWDFPIGIPESKYRKWTKIFGGQVWLMLNPGLKNHFFDGHYPKNKMERAALAGLVYRLKKRNETDKLAKLHQKIWENTDGFSSYESTMELLLEVEPYLTDALQSLPEINRFNKLVEIGCGTGKFLSYFSSKFPFLEKFVGVDISPSQIEQNKKKFSGNSKLEFYAEDAITWLEKNAGSDTIYLTYGGVYEYFNENQLETIFTRIAASSKTGIVLFEPFAEDFDLKNEVHSAVDGYEFNFSHPYPHLAKSAGFSITYEKIFFTDNSWWIILAGVKM